jgi:hypothetical protein
VCRGVGQVPGRLPPGPGPAEFQIQVRGDSVTPASDSRLDEPPCQSHGPMLPSWSESSQYPPATLSESDSESDSPPRRRPAGMEPLRRESRPRAARWRRRVDCAGATVYAVRSTVYIRRTGVSIGVATADRVHNVRRTPYGLRRAVYAVRSTTYGVRCRPYGLCRTGTIV